MRAILFAGLSFLGLALALGLPPLVGGSPEFVVKLSAYLVGMQAAQSTVVQTGKPLIRMSGVVLAACAFLSTGFVWIVGMLPGDWRVAQLAVATLAGAILGLWIGHQASATLRNYGGTQYQLLVASRSMLIVLSSAVASISSIGRVPTLLLFAAVFTCLIVLQWLLWGRSYSFAFEEGPGKIPVLMLGLVGSLFYRNDVTWVRAAAESTHNFHFWNYGMILYAAVQSVIGIIVVQRLLAHRAEWVRKLSDITQIQRVTLTIAPLALGACALFASILGSVLIDVGAAVALAVIIGLLSGLAHATGSSSIPYIAGIGGTCVLVGLLSMGWDPGLALVIGNVCILGGVTGGLFLRRVR